MLKIVANHLGVTLYPTEDKHLDWIRPFNRRYIQFQSYWDPRQRRKVNTPVASFLFFRADRSEVRFLRTMLDELRNDLKGQRLIEGLDFFVKEEYHDVPKTKHLTMKSDWIPREEQAKAIEFVKGIESGAILLHLQTGGGKSSLALYLASTVFKHCFVCVMRPTFIGTGPSTGWLKAINKDMVNFKKHEICTVRGSEQLISLMNDILDKGHNPYKAILLSSRTIQNYLSTYEDNKDDPKLFESKGYPVKPQDFSKLLEVDTIYYDEAHFDHNFVCHLVSTINTKRFIGMSATPDADMAFQNRMMKLLFPLSKRYVQKVANVYQQPIAWHYQFKRPEYLRVTTKMGYSHILLEQTIMKRGWMMDAYFKLIKKAIDDYFYPKHQANNKLRCVVTVATIEMARELKNYIEEQYTGIFEKVTTYVEGENVSNLYGATLCVSTIIGAGTGHDIPMLSTVIMTNAISSTKSNLQAIGRLRKLEIENMPDIEHSFVYFVADNLDQHVKYHHKKVNETFKGRTLPVRNVDTGVII